MIDGQRVVALIPARGGSKSIPRKNLRILGGVPLIGWAIKSARMVPEIDRIIVSTDDNEIRDVSLLFGAEVYMRPSNLATDSALVVETVRFMTKVLEAEGERAEIFVLLEPTCPLRPEGLVSKCLTELVSQKSESVATFERLQISPERIWRIDQNSASPYIDGSIPWKPRQELPVGYQLNGAVYVFLHKLLPVDFPGLLFGKNSAVIMDEKMIDIDTYEDLETADDFLGR